MPNIRSLIRSTPIGRSLSHSRYLRRLREWSELDETAARFYSQFLSAGKLCFDIGANVGDRVKVFRRLGATVIALEPQRTCCEILHELYGADPNVSILQLAAGSECGAAEIHTSGTDMLSSLSADWMRAVSESGRFPADTWTGTQQCRVTTVDQLIAVFGTPHFIKIDVEGFEAEVMAGLSTAVACLSFEYTQEYGNNAILCVQRLSSLGYSSFAFSPAESFELSEWLSATALCEQIASASGDKAWGDIYARSGQA